MTVNLRGLVRKQVARCYAVAAVPMTALLFAQVAAAAPAGITGAPVQFAIPGIGDPAVSINLRQQGVVNGSAPLSIDPASVQLLVNGTVAPGSLIFNRFPNNGPGFVCLSIVNGGNFNVPTGVTFSLRFTVDNLAGPAFTTPGAGVQLINAPAPFNAATCDDPNAPPVANAGPDRTVADTDGIAGNNVVLDAAGSSDPDAGTVLTYQWFEDGEISLGPPSTSPTLTVNLADGVHNISLLVLDDSGDSGNDQAFDNVQITVNAPVVPTVNAGADRTIADTDREPGEAVTLTGTASDPDGTIVSYQWFLVETLLGTGPTITTRLPDGENTVTLVVTDNAGTTASDQVTITVGAVPARGTLSEIPNLDPNQRRVAQALDRVCTTLDDSGSTLTPDQRDLLNKCNGIYFNNSVANQVQALEELVGDDFAVARTQTLLFANTQYASVMDRLMALRGGARGLSLAGLNIIVDGKPVPLAQLQDMAKGLLGGGASADEPGGLLSDKWGLWARGNYSFGEKETTRSSPSFDADQWAMVGGIDYRLSDKAVLGFALSYGQASVEFSPTVEGALDTTSWAGSFYGSVYAAKNFYFDAIVNVSNSSYEAERNISYNNGVGLLPTNVNASGDTDGMTLSGGMSAGYDFLLGGLTLSPNLGFFYIDTTIDGFTESDAGGLNLIYDEQKFKSLTGNLGFRATYAWNVSWGVLLPHVRIDYVREFEDDVDVFGVRFAADPNAASAPPILIETDNPDTSYWRLAAGFSAQFKHGFSGYVEYQRLESFEFISFQDVSIGLRMQRSF